MNEDRGRQSNRETLRPDTTFPFYLSIRILRVDERLNYKLVEPSLPNGGLLWLKPSQPPPYEPSFAPPYQPPSLNFVHDSDKLGTLPSLEPLNGPRYNYCSTYVTPPRQNYYYQPSPGSGIIPLTNERLCRAGAGDSTFALWAGIEEHRSLTKFIRVNSRCGNFGNLQLVDEPTPPGSTLTTCMLDHLNLFFRICDVRQLHDKHGGCFYILWNASFLFILSCC